MNELVVGYSHIKGVCDCCGRKGRVGCNCYLDPDVTWFLCEDCLEFIGGIMPVVGVDVHVVAEGDE